MRIRNLTAHDVNIVDNNGKVIKTYRPDGVVARLEQHFDKVGEFEGVPLLVREESGVRDLPDEEKGTYLIVSNLILDMYPNRRDLLSPVKQFKINGKVVGCRAFACAADY